MKNTGVGEKKTVKKPSQTSRGVLVGLKMGFKPQKEYKKEYRPVTRKPNASSISNKKKGVKLTIEVSNSNPFDVLNSVDNDVEFGKLRLLDNDGNLLVPTGIKESDNEMELVFDEAANLRIPMSGKAESDKGFRATTECDMRVEEGPRGGHLRDETRMKHGVPSFAMLRSWNAP
nr:hypothetical protein [Tanacetum cinerariifolium]